jgi:hypothetical protein
MLGFRLCLIYLQAGAYKEVGIYYIFKILLHVDLLPDPAPSFSPNHYKQVGELMNLYLVFHSKS